ncbi:hypothetical protein E1193_15470 [Micromonospora sp. KC606]|uniref:hypothetical protein n=1 Tax=Micromonospora sp. KC606 TaxID=2530379 RepID=UPI00104B7B85|nr:hypothetical protein [Micromonospora sp. KC606]TDC81175.1 hypothetical protein E1193_15470 [Micromonospora sp. KC606]
MAETDSTGSTWRYNWAGRQNERRQRRHREAEAAWRRHDDELRRLRTLALDLRGSTAAGRGLPLALDHGEKVLRAWPAAQLVELRHTIVLPAPELTVEPHPAPLRHRPPDGVRAVDAGMAVVTNRRLVFLGGSGRRDWAYGKMTGLSHDPAAPVTLIEVLDRKRTTGLRLPAPAAVDFRFVLTLAFADAIEQRDTVLAQLDELIAEHDQNRPFRPAIATPGQARLTARIPGGRRTVVVAAALTLAVPVAVLDSDPPVRSAAERAVAATPATSTTPKAKPVAKPRPSPSGDAAPRERRCGAPANPMGYDFCAGERIRRPDHRICDHFDCVRDFWSGRGYLVQCRDGSVSLTGGRRDACADHRGVRRTVFT